MRARMLQEKRGGGMDEWREPLKKFVHEHKERTLFCVLSICFLIGAWSALLFPSEEPSVPSAVSKKDTATAEQKTASAHNRVQDFKPATIRNPFTYAHETESEAAAAQTPTPAPAEEKATPPPVAVPVPPSSAPAPLTPEPPSPPLTLSGIAQSENERIAALSDGTHTYFLGVGDRLGSYTVSAIGESEVTLAGAHETRNLRLPGF